MELEINIYIRVNIVNFVKKPFKIKGFRVVDIRHGG